MKDDDIKTKALNLIKEMRLVILAFIVLCVVTLPCAFLIGYRTQWILWKLGLN